MRMGTSTVVQKFAAIDPLRVRYIKLGEGGDWERQCLDQGIIRFGFGSENAERLPLCRSRRWDELTKSFIKEGRNIGTATRFTNETRIFFEDNGTTLWITFHGECLWWGLLESMSPEPHVDGHGVWRKVAGGWRSYDINGDPLTNERLSGALTKLAAYRGTSCNVDKSKYVVRRINGQKMPEVEHAVEAVKALEASALELIRMLEPGDFEILVDLIFSTSGWQRQGTIGKTQKTLDIDLMLPSTGEKAFVQVKSETTSAQLAEYVEKLQDFGQYSKMFYVYHTGEAATKDNRVEVWNPQKLSELIVDAGLVNWLIRKVS